LTTDPITPHPIPTRRSSDLTNESHSNQCRLIHPFVYGLHISQAKERLCPARSNPSLRLLLNGFVHLLLFFERLPKDTDLHSWISDRKSTRLNSSHVSSSSAV